MKRLTDAELLELSAGCANMIERLRAIETAAYERAARVCHDVCGHYDSRTQLDAAYGAERCEAAIRAMAKEGTT